MNTITPIRRFFKLLQVDKQEIISVYVYALFYGIVSLSLPLGIQAIINLISGGQISTSWIVLVIFVILGVAFTGVLQIMQLIISENIQQKIFTRSAFEFAFRIPRMKIEALEKDYPPELINRFFDTLTVQKGLSKILMDFSSASLQIVFGLLLLSFYHPFFILFSVTLIFIIYLIFKFTAEKGLKTSLVESKHKYEVLHWLEELGRTMETFKLSGGSPLPMEKTDKVVKNYLVSRKTHFKTLVVQYINLVGFKVIIAAGLLLIGGLLVINQKMNIGQFVAAEIIIILVLGSVEKLILSMETIYDVLTAIEKIGAVTDIPLEEVDGTKVDTIQEEAISVSLNELSYRYASSVIPVLKDINLDIKQGEKICVSGFPNSGKSMLLQLLSGLYPNFSGNMIYNGIPFGNWCKEDLRSIIGDSLSKEEIFKGSLFENITLGMPNMSLDKVHEIAELTGLSPFISSLPKGYNTPLLPEGKNLPKHIRQKIVLARSLSSHPKLILLDDNINQIEDAVKLPFIAHLIKSKSTVVIISNNEKIARLFDRTVVLKDGEVLADKPLTMLETESWFSNVFQTK